MFLCRRLIFQVHIPQLPHLVLVRRNLLNAINPSPHAHSNTHHDRPFKNIDQKDAPESPISMSVPALLQRLSNVLPEGAEDVEDEGQVEGRPGISELDAYEILRGRDRSLVADLPPATYLRVLKQAFLKKSSDLVVHIAMDVLEVHRCNDTQRNNMIRSIFSLADLSLLQQDTILLMLRHLEKTSGALPVLSLKSAERLARIIVDSSPTSSATDMALLELVYPILLSHLKRFHVPPGALSLGYHPPAMVHVSFSFLQKLLTIHQNQRALDVFQVLVDSGHIPPEAIQGVNSSSKDFQFIVRSALVRACLHWNWRTLGVQFLTDMFRPGRSGLSSDPSIVDLTVDTLYVLLDTPTPRDVHACRLLICEVHEVAPVPDGLIRQFYNSAIQLMLGDEAESLYAFTRSPAIIVNHQYPPPRGLALTWLMHHLTVKSRNIHLGRLLAMQVMEGNEPIPLQYRARFISVAAAHGYATIARTLWERYSVGKDRNAVVGNSALMIRMISLFTHLIKRTDNVLQQKENDRQGEFLDVESLRKRWNDFTTFADRVLSEFRQSHDPLASAHHHTLTSLARACFILGKVTEGFEVFKILLDRKEMPDLYDVNVALTVMAEHQPRTAARMIERMMEKGLQPDAITYGTVMHHALLHRDMPLVSDMISRARGLDHAQLSLKSVVALIRGGLAVDDNTKAVQRSKLESALNIIKTLLDSKFVCSPQTGKYCVFAALRADDPVMAYRFWKLLVKDKAEWDDREQKFQRRLITTMIRRHQQRDWLDDDRSIVMLSQLRGETGDGTVTGV